MPKIKYIKDAEDVDIDVEMTVFDALMNEGAAKRDGLDQQAVIKLVFEGGLRVREGSIVPDLSLAKFQFAPPPPPPPFGQVGQIFTQAKESRDQHMLEVSRSSQAHSKETNRLIPSIERDGYQIRSKGEHIQEKGSPIVIQDSQAILGDGSALINGGDEREEEPKSESPELLNGPHHYPPTQKGDLEPTEPAIGIQPQHNTTPALRSGGDEIAESTAGRASYHSLQDDTSSHPQHDFQSPLQNKSRASGPYIHEEGSRNNNGKSLMTPPGNSNCELSRTKSTSSRLSRPSCRISPRSANVLNHGRMPSTARVGKDVYDVLESEIEDTQRTPMVPLKKKRKLHEDNRSSSSKDQPYKKVDRRPSLRSAEKLGSPEISGTPSTHRKDTPNQSHFSMKEVSAPRTTSIDSSRENQSVYSDAVTGQDEVDQQLFESTNAATDETHESNEHVDSDGGEKTHTFIHEDARSEHEPPRYSSVIDDSGPRYAGGSARNSDLPFGDTRQHNTESDSEKENIRSGPRDQVENDARQAFLPPAENRENIADIGPIEASSDTVQSKSSQTRTRNNRVALGLLNDTSKEENDVSDPANNTQDEALEDAREDSSSPTSEQIQQQHPRENFSARPSAESHEDSLDNDYEVNEILQKPVPETRKRKRVFVEIPKGRSTPRRTAFIPKSHNGDHCLEIAGAATTRTKKSQQSSSNTNDARGAAPTSQTAAPQPPRITRKPKKKVPLVVEKETIPKASVTAKTIDKESDVGGNDARPCSTDRASADAFARINGPSGAPSKSSVMENTTPDSGVSASRLPKRRRKANGSSTALVPGGRPSNTPAPKQSRSAVDHSGDVSSKAKASNSKSIIKDAEPSKSAPREAKGVHSTASPAPILPAGMTEESYRKKVSGFVDKPYITKQRQKQTPQPSIANASRENADEQVEDRVVGATKTDSKVIAKAQNTGSLKGTNQVKPSTKSAKLEPKIRKAQTGGPREKPLQMTEEGGSVRHSKTRRASTDQSEAVVMSTKALSDASAAEDGTSENQSTSPGKHKPQSLTGKEKGKETIAAAKTNTSKRDRPSTLESPTDGSGSISPEANEIPKVPLKTLSQPENTTGSNRGNRVEAPMKSPHKPLPTDQKDSGFESGVASNSKSPENPKASDVPRPGKTGLAARRKLQEEQKAASQAAERKAEAEKQRARLAQSTSRSDTSSSESMDSSDEAGSDSDTIPPVKSAIVAGNSTKSSHAFHDHRKTSSALMRPFKAPSSNTKRQASEDTSSDAGSEESDDTEIVKADTTPPRRKGPPRSLIDEIAKDSKGMSWK